MIILIPKSEKLEVLPMLDVVEMVHDKFSTVQEWLVGMGVKSRSREVPNMPYGYWVEGHDEGPLYEGDKIVHEHNAVGETYALYTLTECEFDALYQLLFVA